MQGTHYDLALLAPKVPHYLTYPDSPGMPTLFSWWKADSYTYGVQYPVAGNSNQWVDQSGNGRNAYSLSCMPPLFGGCASFFPSRVNGRAALDFSSGANSAIGFPDFLASGVFGTSWTALVVLQGPGISPGGDQILIYSTSQGHRMLVGPDTIGFFLLNQPVTVNYNRTSGNALYMATWRANLGNLEVLENKNQIGARAGLADTGRFNQISVPGFLELNAEVCEIVLYNGYLDNTNLGLLYDNYMKPRWGLP